MQRGPALLKSPGRCTPRGTGTHSRPVRSPHFAADLQPKWGSGRSDDLPGPVVPERHHEDVLVVIVRRQGLRLIRTPPLVRTGNPRLASVRLRAEAALRGGPPLLLVVPFGHIVIPRCAVRGCRTKRNAPDPPQKPYEALETTTRPVLQRKTGVAGFRRGGSRRTLHEASRLRVRPLHLVRRENWPLQDPHPGGALS